MSNLLQVIRVHPKAATQKGNIPLIMEFHVTKETAPYLVTSSEGLMWIENPHPGDVVKAAIREIPTPGQLFWAMALSVAHRGLRDEWGNVQPFSKGGVIAATMHLEDYDLGELEILVPRIRVQEKDEEGNVIEDGKIPYQRPDWLHPDILGFPVRPTSWIPDDCAVVVPKDREFVGLLNHITPKKIAAVAHNPSRSIAVAWDGARELVE